MRAGIIAGPESKSSAPPIQWAVARIIRKALNRLGDFLGGDMIRPGWVVAVAAILAGCNLNGFEDSNRLDPEKIDALIDKAPYPDYTPSATAYQPSRITVRPDGTRSIELDLTEALRLILLNNQNWLGQSEGLDLQLLSLEVLRRSWWPMQSPLTGSFSWADPKDASPATAQSDRKSTRLNS